MTIIYIVAGLAVVTLLAIGLMGWDRVVTWFRDSETIAFARAQLVTGVVLAGGVLADTLLNTSLIKPVLPADWLPYYLIVSGLATEWLRRRRATDL